MWCAFIFLITLLVRLLRAACLPRNELILENLALRQQVSSLKLGTHRPRLLSETTVSRYVRQLRERNPDPYVLQRWVAFLRNHKAAIAGMDFFTVPTATMNILYGFFIIHHDRRRVLHFNATYHPTATAASSSTATTASPDRRPL